MDEQEKFDVFISYRNSYYEIAEDGSKRKIDVGFGVARELALVLNYKKYNVYFDNLTLSGGDDYERHIFKSLPQCNDVVLVLVPQALERCKPDGTDIFGREIVAALESGKNIIPIFVNGFAFPETVEELPEMLRAPALRYREKTGRSFVRLQGAKIRMSEKISTDDSRTIRNAIQAEVIPYLKSLPVTAANPIAVPRDLPGGSRSPWKVKRTLKILLTLAVLGIVGVAGYFGLSKNTESLPKPEARDETAVAATKSTETQTEAPASPQSTEGVVAQTERKTPSEAPVQSEPEKTGTEVSPTETGSSDNKPNTSETRKSSPASDETKEAPAQEPVTPLSGTDAKKGATGTSKIDEPEPKVTPVSVADLVAAVKGGDAEAVDNAINSGTDVNAVLENGTTVLCSAVIRDNLEIVSKLLDAGADPNFSIAKSGLTPLHLAVSQGKINNVKLLLAAGADAAAKTKDGQTPADFAETEELKKLLSAFVE